MNKLNDAKSQYDKIEIPEELSFIVKQALSNINDGEKKPDQTIHSDENSEAI